MATTGRRRCTIRRGAVRRLALLAGLGLAAAAMPSNAAVADDPPAGAGAAILAADPALIPLDPARFVETREGATTFDGLYEGAGQRTAGSIYEIQFGGRGGVPIDAAGVAIYLTAVDPTGWGFLTTDTCGSALPVASSLNYYTGTTVGNEIVADLSTSGSLCIYTYAATDLTVDVVGYVPTGNSIVPIGDKRVLESREGASTVDGISEGIGRTAPGSTTTVQVTGRADVPLGTDTVIVNVAALDPTDSGFITVHPCLPTLPTASSLNYSPGIDRANELITPVNGAGQLCIYTQHDVDLIVDVVGYVPTGTNYVNTPSRRFLETRAGAPTFDGQNQGEGVRAAGSQYTLPITGRGGIPDGAIGVIANVASVDAASAGFLTVHPCKPSLPVSASLNYTAGVNGADEIVASLSDAGEICIYTSAATHLLVDVTGYLMPRVFAATDSYDALGNVLLEVGVPASGFPAVAVTGSVLDNDIGAGALTVTGFDAASANGGSVAMGADGTFTYSPPPGYTDAADTFEYTLTDGDGATDVGTVSIDLTDMVWFVDNTSAGPVKNGTSGAPFDQLADAGPPSGPGEPIFVYEGDGTDTGYDQGITLDANQDLIGEKVGLTLGATVLVPPGGGRPVLSASGGADTVAMGSGGSVQSATLRITGSGAAISSAGAGGTVTDVDIEANSMGIDLDNTTGTFTFTDVDVTSSGESSLRVFQGSADVDFVNSTIAQSGNAPAVDVFDHTGSVDFDATSTVDATDGDGMRFDFADGMYDFRGQVTLNGGDAGIDIFSDSAGTFTFTDVDITDTSPNAAIDINGNGAAKLFLEAGSTITQANNGLLLAVSNGHTGEVHLAAGATMTATNGAGLQFNNADGTYDFQGTVTLNGGDAGIDILGGSAGTFTFAPTTTITNPTGPAVNIDNFAAGGDFDFDGSIVANSDRVVAIATTAAGSSIHFDTSGANSLTSTGNPNPVIDIFDADGDITMTTPTTVTDSTFSPLFATAGAGNWSFTDLTVVDLKDLNSGVDVFGNTGTVKFTDLDITTDSAGTGSGAVGFWAGGNNSIIVDGNSTIDADGGPAISLGDITTIDMTFASLTSTNNTNAQIGPAGNDGLSLLDVGGGTFDVIGTTTVTGAGGSGISISNVGATVTFASVDIDGVDDWGLITGVASDNPGVIAINGGTIANTGNHGLRIGSSVLSHGAASVDVDNVTFTAIAGFVVEVANSTVGGSGNVAAAFSCNDLGGNTGQISFNAGANLCPP